MCTRFPNVVLTGGMELTVEHIYLAGSVDALKNWSPINALPMSAENYPTWSSTCHI